VDAFERQWPQIAAIMATHAEPAVKLRLATTQPLAPALSPDHGSVPHPQFAGRG